MTLIPLGGEGRGFWREKGAIDPVFAGGEVLMVGGFGIKRAYGSRHGLSLWLETNVPA
jgi:hypothetical protein